ncbi:MAG: outer membrane lipoprotein chaperone LolA [Polyangiales bacterium]
MKHLSSLSNRLVSPSLVVAGLALAPFAFAQTAPSASTAASAVAAPSASASAPALPALTAAEVATKMQTAYTAITTYDADFEQTYTMKSFGGVKTQKGKVYFEKPGKMRWEYAEPKDKVVVSDGTTLWSYDPADKLARKMAVKDGQEPTALAFLTGKGDLQKDFNLEIMPPATSKYPTGYTLKATPKTATSLYTFVLFYIDATKFHVQRVLIVDGQDNRNRFDFKGANVNAKYAASQFTWTPPAGVTVTTN